MHLDVFLECVQWLHIRNTIAFGKKVWYLAGRPRTLSQTEMTKNTNLMVAIKIHSTIYTILKASLKYSHACV